LQKNGFGYDRASVALDVWDSVVGHKDNIDRKMVVFQSLTTPGGIRLPAVKTTPSPCVSYPSYAIENRAVMTKLAV